MSTLLAVDYPGCDKSLVVRCVFRVSPGASTRVEAETTGILVATRTDRADGSAHGRDWWPVPGQHLPAASLLNAAPVVTNRPPPPPPVVLAIDAVAWSKLPDAARARLRAVLSWTKGPGVMCTGPVPVPVATLVRHIAGQVGVAVLEEEAVAS